MCIRDSYEDGTVAAVRNSYGKGQAILFGSVVFDPVSNARPLTGFIPEECLSPVKTEPEVFARMLSTDSEAAVVVVNPQDRDLEVGITPKDVIIPEEVPDLWNQSQWSVRDKVVRLSLKPWGVAVLLFRRK